MWRYRAAICRLCRSWPEKDVGVPPWVPDFSLFLFRRARWELRRCLTSLSSFRRRVKRLHKSFISKGWIVARKHTFGVRGAGSSYVSFQAQAPRCRPWVRMIWALYLFFCSGWESTAVPQWVCPVKAWPHVQYALIYPYHEVAISPRPCNERTNSAEQSIYDVIWWHVCMSTAVGDRRYPVWRYPASRVLANDWLSGGSRTVGAVGP